MKRLPLGSVGFAVTLAAVVGLWARIISTLYTLRGGLFRSIGTDWGGYYTQASALADGKLASLYDLEALAPYRQLLAVYSGDPSVPTYPILVSYPLCLPGCSAR